VAGTRNVFNGLVVAAGYGTRIGRPKATLECGGKPLVEKAALTLLAAGCNGVVAVVGPDWKYWRFKRDIFEYIVTNSEPKSGQGSSVLLGANAAVNTETMVILPVDSALVGTKTVKRLIEIAAENPDKIVKPVYNGRGGHPMIIPARMLLSNSEILLEKGLRALQYLPDTEVLRIETSDRYCVYDIDFLKDYMDAPCYGANNHKMEVN